MSHNGISVLPNGVEVHTLTRILEMLTESQRNGSMVGIAGSYQLHQGEKVFVVERMWLKEDKKLSQMSDQQFQGFLKACKEAGVRPIDVLCSDDTIWRHVYAADAIKKAVMLNCLSPFRKQDMIHIAVITSMGEGKDHLIENIIQPLVPCAVASSGKLCTIPGLFGAMSGEDLNSVELGLIGKMNNERIAVSEFQTWSSEVFGELMNMLANGYYTMQKGQVDVTREAVLNMSFWGNPEKSYSDKMDKLAMLDVFKEYTFQMISRMTLIFAQMSLTFGDDNADKFVKRKIMDAMTGKFETPDAKANLTMWRRFFREYLRYVSRMSPNMGVMEQGLFDMMQEIEGTQDFKAVFLQRSERENRKFQQFINLCKGLARLNGDQEITADHLYDAKWLFQKSLETLVKNVPLNQDLLEADGKVQHMYSQLLKNSDNGHYESLLVAKKRMSELGHSLNDTLKEKLIEIGVMDVIDGRVVLYEQ
jgi:DNA replicative helicase MCM subunit Mcm2 (Cdc46/Mcm family)